MNDTTDDEDIRLMDSHDIRVGDTHCRCGERIISYGRFSRRLAVQEHHDEVGYTAALKRIEARARSAGYRPYEDHHE